MERDEVSVALRRPEQLFVVDPGDFLHDPAEARTEPGIDELLAQVLGRRTRRAPQLVVQLPAEHVRPDTAERLTAGVRRWCNLRRNAGDREMRVLWRQGLRSLRSGSVLFLVGLVLSSGFIEPGIPTFLQDLLGNGVFLVVAWVGLWYPLDLLFFSRLPLRRQARVLDAMVRHPVIVRVRPVQERPSA